MSDSGSTTAARVTLLVDRHSEELFAYLWRLLLDAQDAEDCLQQTFLQAYRNLDRLRPDSNMRAWLYRVAGNQARSCLRKRRRQAVWLEPDGVEQQSAGGDDPAELVERGWIEQAIGGLPPRQHEALILRKYQGLSYDAIARIQGNSPQAARANVYQALRRLRSMVESERRSVR